jgi:hypothetical protein
MINMQAIPSAECVGIPGITCGPPTPRRVIRSRIQRRPFSLGAGAIDDRYIARARTVPIEDIISERGIKLRRSGGELIGPCPNCGGDDRFAVNLRKQIFNCRKCNGGGDAIELIRFLDGVDFPAAIEKLIGQSPPRKKPNGNGACHEGAPILAGEFIYENENGEPHIKVQRFDRRNADGSPLIGDDGKTKKFFVQWHADPNNPGQWIKGTEGVRRILYRLPELIEAVGNDHMIVIAEGERKAELLRSWNIPATCSLMGAKNWLDDYAAIFSGADVVVLPDNDSDGRYFLNKVAESLIEAGASVRALNLPGLGPKGDIVDWAAAGGTVEQLHALIEHEERPLAPGHDEEQAAPAVSTRLLSYAEMIALMEGEWLIQYVLALRAKNVLFGQSNSFKSFIATDMACSVATGRSYHGNSTKKCPVIYIANEGANAVGRKRIPAWMAAHEIPQSERGNIYFINAETILPNETSRNNLLIAIRSIVAPGEDFFLIIDVLRGTMTGSDSDYEAAAAWTAAAEILVKEGATILTVTHSPYSDDGRIRGSSHLWGSFEGRLHAEGDKERRTRVLKVDRFKDHDSHGQWGFQLDEFEVEEHPGESSLVPRLDGEVKAKAKASRGKRKLAPGQANVLEALRYALDEVGAIPAASNHIPANVKCVTLEQWRSYFDHRTTLDKEDSREKAFSRGSQKLQSANYVGI